MASLKSIFNQTRTLPNLGGTYTIGNTAHTTPSSSFVRQLPAVEPDFTLWKTTLPESTPAVASNSIATNRMFSQPSIPPPTTPVQEEQLNIPPGLVNPVTGQLYTADEVINNIIKKIPMTNSDIGKYAGDALAQPRQSMENLTDTARTLVNNRNDIATGTTDPYRIGKDSGIAYSPAQLAAIEKAYAGIYDPAINDVFNRIKQLEKLEEEYAKAKTEEAKLKVQKEMAVFNTNENIRQWRETTGSRKSGDDDDKIFSQTQINNGAAAAGMTIKDFEKLDDDIKNFYINPPKSLDDYTNKMVPKYEVFENLLEDVANGDKTTDEVTNLIVNSETLPVTVKQYFVSRMPLPPEEKQKKWYDIFKKIIFD